VDLVKCLTLLIYLGLCSIPSFVLRITIYCTRLLFFMLSTGFPWSMDSSTYSHTSRPQYIPNEEDIHNNRVIYMSEGT